MKWEVTLRPYPASGGLSVHDELFLVEADNKMSAVAEAVKKLGPGYAYCEWNAVRVELEK